MPRRRIFHQNMLRFAGKLQRVENFIKEYQAYTTWQGLWGGRPMSPLICAGFTEVLRSDQLIGQSLRRMGQALMHDLAPSAYPRAFIMPVGLTAVGGAWEYVALLTHPRFEVDFFGFAFKADNRWQAAAFKPREDIETWPPSPAREVIVKDRLNDAAGSRYMSNIVWGSLRFDLDIRGMAFVAGVDTTGGGRQPIIIGMMHSNYTTTIFTSLAGVMIEAIRERCVLVDKTYKDAPVVVGGDFNREPDKAKFGDLEQYWASFLDMGGGIRTTYSHVYDYWIHTSEHALFQDRRASVIENTRRPPTIGRLKHDLELEATQVRMKQTDPLRYQESFDLSDHAAVTFEFGPWEPPAPPVLNAGNFTQPPVMTRGALKAQGMLDLAESVGSFVANAPKIRDMDLLSETKWRGK